MMSNAVKNILLFAINGKLDLKYIGKCGNFHSEYAIFRQIKSKQKARLVDVGDYKYSNFGLSEIFELPMLELMR